MGHGSWSCRSGAPASPRCPPRGARGLRPPGSAQPEAFPGSGIPAEELPILRARAARSSHGSSHSASGRSAGSTMARRRIGSASVGSRLHSTSNNSRRSTMCRSGQPMSEAIRAINRRPRPAGQEIHRAPGFLRPVRRMGPRSDSNRATRAAERNLDAVQQHLRAELLEQVRHRERQRRRQPLSVRGSVARQPISSANSTTSSSSSAWRASPDA